MDKPPQDTDPATAGQAADDSTPMPFGLWTTMCLIGFMTLASASGFYHGVMRTPREVAPTDWGPELAFASAAFLVLCVPSWVWLVRAALFRRIASDSLASERN